MQSCRHLQRIAGLDDHTELTELHIIECSELEELPVICGPSGLERITIDGCGKLICLKVTSCGILKGVLGNFAQLWLLDCPELEELPSFAHLTCLEEIHIIKCGKLQEMTLSTTLKLLHLDACTELQSVPEITHLKNLVELIISQCWQLEFNLHLVGMNSLQSIMFDGCGRLNSFLLNKCQNLKNVSGNFNVEWLSLCDCLELEELSICDYPRLRCMEMIHIESCYKLQNIKLPAKFIKLILQRFRLLPRIARMDDLTELCISECDELDQLPSLAGLSCLIRIKIDSFQNLHNLRLLTILNKLSLHRCRWQMMEGIGNLTKLTKKSISECPELEELPIIARLSCLESINIDSYENLHNITLPTTVIKLTVHFCRKLQLVAGAGNPTKLADMVIFECPKLEKLSNPSEMCFLESISIDHCKRLKNITLPTTLIKLRV
ncbi:hypothetical protein SUGI_0400440 [Cryptomeria japonica]|nr:hypothetical protein SUGI_0400440 [Cryptomeria japonica]